MRVSTIAAFSALFLTGGLASAQQLLVPESTNDDVMLFDANDGSLINASFIDLTPFGALTPIECHEGPDRLYVSDQSADSVFMFSLDGTTHLGTITGGMDNIRGLCFTNGVLYVSNSGTGNGAPGDAVIMFDSVGNPMGSFPVGDPFDVVDYAGGLLTTDIAGEDLVQWDYAGNFLQIFHDSDGVTGIDFPEQANLMPSTGGVLAAGFSSPSGIYEYDTAGTQVNYWAVGSAGNRGVWELGNGNILFTNGNGVHVLDPTTGSEVTVVSGVSSRFIQPYTGGGSGGPGTAYCFCNVGNPSGNAAPCGNENDGSNGDAGCKHDDNAGGATLGASGNASISGDTLVLNGAGGVISNSSLFFQADNNLDGTNNYLGDGIRCTGGGLIRIQPRQTDASGNASTTIGISAKTGVSAGQTKYYQWWFRDPNGSPCTNESNTSNGYEITWQL